MLINSFSSQAIFFRQLKKKTNFSLANRFLPWANMCGSTQSCGYRLPFFQCARFSIGSSEKKYWDMQFLAAVL